ncbi:MAG: antitoxin [Desulfuromonadaceae bacterium]|nr:antitoxin [Desulfuromonadaceae bacterium]
MTKYHDIYRAALAKWGEEAQFDQAVEECAELIVALKHFKRDKVDLQEIVDELADVALMVGQLSFMLGEERVEQTIEAKLCKLKLLLASDDSPEPS